MRRLRRAFERRDGGMTLIEMMVALVIVTITMTALLATLITGVKAGRAAESRTRANQVAAEELERLRAIAWDRLGFYESDFVPFPASHDGESIVKLPPSTDRYGAPEPTSIVVVDGEEFTVTRWVTWAGAEPNDGSLYAAKRISIGVSWGDRSGDHAVTTEGLRSPTPTEMAPPALSGDSGPASLTMVDVVGDQELTVAGQSTQELIFSAEVASRADGVVVTWQYADGSPGEMDLEVDAATGKYWIGQLPTGSGPFSAGTMAFTFTASKSGHQDSVKAASVGLTSPIATDVSISETSVGPSQQLDSSYQTVQALELKAVTTGPVSKVEAATYTGGERITVLLSRQGTEWVGTLQSPAGPFAAGEVEFTFVATSTTGMSYSATARALLMAPEVGEIIIGEPQVTPQFCIDIKRDANTLMRPSTILASVRNIAITDSAWVTVGGIRYVASIYDRGANGFEIEALVPTGASLSGSHSEPVIVTVQRAGAPNSISRSVDSAVSRPSNGKVESC